MVITTTQLHSIKPEISFSAGSNLAHSMSEIWHGEDLCIRYSEEKSNIFCKIFGVSPLSIKLFCTTKLMQKYTINLTRSINATIG